MKFIQLRSRKILSGILSLLVVVIAMVSCKEKPPRANFVFIVEKGGIVHFTNTTAGKITKLSWDFGDLNTLGVKNTSVETSPIHRYLKGGVYSVTLTVSNDGGADNITKEVTIEEGDRQDIGDYPTFADAEGYFYARNIFEFDPITPDILTEKKASALVAMYDSTNFLVSVGGVSVNGTNLTHNSDNVYSYHSKDSSWYFRDKVLWSAEGASGFPTIVENVSKIEFPIISALVSKKTLVRNVDTSYIMRMKIPVLLADSIKFRIETTSKTLIVEKRTGSGISGVEFDKKDIQKLTRGDYITKVIAYSYEKKNFNLKPVYFTKESYTEGTLTVR